MDEDLFISVLKSLSPESREYLSQCPIQASCVFTQQIDCEDQDQFVPAPKPYVFQIRQDFLVECQPKSKKICGGIQLSLDYKFQIKRFIYDPDEELGRPYAFVLYFPEPENNDDSESQQQQVAIKLGVRIQAGEELENFARCLQSKTIFQLDICTNYKITERLFMSSAAAIYTARRLRDEKQVVIKCIKKQIFTMSGRDLKKGIQREYEIPKKLAHQNICQYYAVYQNQSSVYIVLQRLQFNFLQFLFARPQITVPELKEYFYSICQTIAWLHYNGVMHRDLKPENIMMRNVQNRFEPVLIDFGLAEYQDKKPYLFVRCGTPGYAAPQITKQVNLKSNYDKSCDVFSLGCLLHFLLLRRPLFNGNSIQQVIENNKKCQINPQSQIYKNLDANSKDLLFKMLQVLPQKRIKMEQVVCHKFFPQNSEQPKPKQQITEQESQINSSTNSVNNNEESA